MDESHLRVVQPELCRPRFVHPVEVVELLDCTLVENCFGLCVFEELVDGLCDESNREVVVAVMTEHRLQER